MIKYKELKKDTDYKIPCNRENNESDFITIKVFYDERYKCDVAFINNEFMGAHLKKVRDDANWFKITTK